MPIQQLFEITEEGDGLVVNLIPVINEHPFDIIAKRNGALGVRELLYCWCASDILSPFTNLEHHERHYRSKKLSKLPEDWEPDDLIKEGIQKYAELQYLCNPELKFLKELQHSLSLSGDIISTLRRDMTQKLEEFGTSQDKKLKNEIVKEILNNVAVIIKMSGDLQETVMTINKLQEKFINDTLNMKQVRGKGDVGMFEDPESIGVKIGG